MEKHTSGKTGREVSRRDFIKTSAAVSLAAMLPGAGSVFAAGSDRLKIGLVGCGGRGTGAVKDCVASSEGIELVTMGDLFKDRLEASYIELADALPKESLNIKNRQKFVGFDAYKKVIKSGIDVVLLATPPGYRPEHIAYAVKSGVHVFMEKPVAVDPVGARSVIASSELAGKKGLAMVAGTQYRHHQPYLEIVQRIRDGQIGEIIGGQSYSNRGCPGDWGEKALRFLNERKAGQISEMEYQCRNWYHFDWTSGDFIVEQAIHQLDAMNWMVGANPVKVLGMGGRQARAGKEFGNVYDHFAVEYEYPDGQRLAHMCRQMENVSIRISIRITGTRGTAYASGNIAQITGDKPWEYEGEFPDPQVTEHADLIKSIRSGKPLNEGRRIAETSLVAIMGRMSAYTGRELSWDWAMKASELDLRPPKYEFGDAPAREIAIPGKTQLV